MQAAEIGWASMAGVWRNRNISMKTKLLVFKCMVRNSILSGQEASNYTELQIHRLGQYQMKKLRIVARAAHLREDGTWVSLSNDELRASVKIATIASELQYRRLKWLQRIGRHPGENLQLLCVLAGSSEWSPPQLDHNFSAEHANPT